jgi:hypothetical protein
MSDPTDREEMQSEESEEWRRSRERGPAIGSPALLVEEEPEEEDDFQSLLNMREDYSAGFDDPELEQLNNPDIQSLPEPPTIGGRTTDSDMWGMKAETAGRMSSPKLYAQANGFPSATQYRVWRWENGIPVAIGAIDIEASEEDFIERFFHAMPEPGDGKFQFRLRPVDIRGSEMGKEITINISEHHEALIGARKRQSRKDEYHSDMVSHGGGNSPIIVNPGGNGGGASEALADEMGRMFEHAVESAERRTQLLQESLESERSKLQGEESRRAEERVTMATTTSQTVQKMMERLMSADRQRGEEQLKGQKEQSNMLMSTLTTVFQQQQEAARQQAERLRENDMSRLSHDREFFDRQRQQQDDMRRMEREEYGRRQEAERGRMGQESSRLQDQRKYEMEQLRLEAQRRDAEIERRRESEKQDLTMRVERERMEMENNRQRMQEERERWRVEIEEKRRTETMEYERKRSAEREEAERKRNFEQKESERREREARERMERERMEFQQRIQMQKTEMESRRLAEERRAREERETWERKMQLEADRRREGQQVQVKQMEIAAQREREHQEKMLRMSQMEREAQRDMLASREKTEQQSRELAESERQRQHSLMLKEMEMSKERDREHAERMIQMTKPAGNGFGGLGEMLGMETPELLGKIFGSGDSGSSWSDAIPKVLGSVAELSKAALSGKTAPKKKKPLSGQMVQVMTPQGPQMIPIENARKMGLLPQESNLPAPRAQTEQNPITDAEVQAMMAQLDEEEGATKDEVRKQPLSREQQIMRAFGKEGAVSDYDAAGHVNIAQMCTEANIKLIEQKKARRDVRKLVNKMRVQSEDEWPDLVLGALMDNADVYKYINALCVYTALREAGADKELSDKIVAALKANEIVPDGLRYTADAPIEPTTEDESND